MKKFFLSLAFSFMTSHACAGEMSFSKICNPDTLGVELKTATGLDFLRTCNASTCTISGYFTIDKNGTTIMVYEELNPDDVFISSAPFTTELKNLITATVGAN